MRLRRLISNSCLEQGSGNGPRNRRQCARLEGHASLASLSPDRLSGGGRESESQDVHRQCCLMFADGRYIHQLGAGRAAASATTASFDGACWIGHSADQALDFAADGWYMKDVATARLSPRTLQPLAGS